MTKALIYRPNNHRLTWAAFECAITIYLTAIAIAGNGAKPVTVISWEDDGPPVTGIDTPPSPQEEPEILPPQQIVLENPEFTDDSVRTPSHPRKKTAVTPIRSGNIGSGQAIHAGSVKSLTLYSPKPNYPYEARRGGVTGSGVAQLTVNQGAGNVIEARMSQSTGNAILDNATVETLRRWRFKPGVPESVSVPITFTLSGVTY